MVVVMVRNRGIERAVRQWRPHRLLFAVSCGAVTGDGTSAGTSGCCSLVGGERCLRNGATSEPWHRQPCKRSQRQRYRRRTCACGGATTVLKLCRTAIPPWPIRWWQ
ncbi:unnamed protein product [Macrosiphum euphorbiae]|uniref:Uncharacterized protein n=1 Tax=Macrosiphum euphorbiae TaxID=13131 RepID=A0AAV0VQ38_9HEMI|nr:unnamed protein product [Macrosiphum euphorbiae]